MPAASKGSLLSEFDDEVAMTRRVLERLPDAALGWRPHDRSMSLGELATHLAHVPRWGASILERDGYDVELDSKGHAAAETTRAAVLGIFDRHTSEVRRALAGCLEAELDAPWALRRAGQLIMSMPRASALRRYVLNHLVHHRGQLTVYLRMHDVPLPPLYGPTADERM